VDDVEACRRLAARDRDALARERRDRRAAGDPVGDEPTPALERLHRRRRAGRERPGRLVRAVAARTEQELEYRDVEADGALRQVATAEQRAAERPERGARPLPRAPVDGEPGARLEQPHRGDRPGAGDAIDRARVDAVRLERDLEPRDLRILGVRDPCRCEGQDRGAHRRCPPG
jgi:hypothetical protein